MWVPFVSNQIHTNKAYAIYFIAGISLYNVALYDTQRPFIRDSERYQTAAAAETGLNVSSYNEYA